MTQEKRNAGWAIRGRRMALRREQQKKIDEAMKEYNQKVYSPAVRDLEKECGEITGHRGMSNHNGAGWVQVSCEYCGKTLSASLADPE